MKREKMKFSLLALSAVGLLVTSGTSLLQAQEVRKRHVIREESEAADPAGTPVRKWVQRQAGKSVVRTLEKGERTWLGLHIGRVSPVTATQLGLKPNTGLVVEHVVAKSPAEEAGLKQYDIVTSFNEQLLVNPDQLQVLVAAAEAGETVSLKVIRGGKKRTIEATLATRKLEALRARTSGLHGRFFSDDEDVKISSGDAAVPVEDAGVFNELILKGKVLGDVPPFHSRTVEIGDAVTVLRDGSGVYRLQIKGGKQFLRFENGDGEVVFDGPFDGDKTKGLPNEVIKRLEEIQVPKELGERQLRRVFERVRSHDGDVDIDVELEHPVIRSGRSL